MPKFQDLTGKTFGYLTVIERAETRHSKTRWLCKCKCGNYTTTITYRLLHNITTSCGCRALEPDKRTFTHGKRNERIYNIWCGMKKRCNNPNEKSYGRYGGKGIKVCDDWNNSFEAFYEWAMSNGYKDDLTIDRIDNAKGYRPDNCRWITLHDQTRNMTRNIFITHNGETKILADWCIEYNFPFGVASQRYRNFKKHGISQITLEMLFYRGNYTLTRVDKYSLDGKYIKT